MRTDVPGGGAAKRHSLGVTQSTAVDATFKPRCEAMRKAIRQLYGHDDDVDETPTRNGVLMRLPERCTLKQQQREAMLRADPSSQVEVEQGGQIVVRLLRVGAVQTPAERAMAGAARLRLLCLALLMLCYAALVWQLPQKYRRLPYCLLISAELPGCGTRLV